MDNIDDYGTNIGSLNDNSLKEVGNLNSVDVNNEELNVEVTEEDSDYGEINETGSSKIIVNNVDSKSYSDDISSDKIIALGASNSEISSVKATPISLTDILSAAKVFNDYVASKKKGIPSKISVGSQNYTIEQFLYLMTSAINNIYNGKTSATYAIKSVNSPAKDLNGDWVTSSTISKANYVDLAKRVLNYINTNGRAPNYATLSDDKKANYKLYTAAFAGILNYYKNNNALPSSYVFSNSIFESYSITKLLSDKSSEKLTFYLTTDNIISNSDNVALNQIKNTLTGLGYNVKIIGVGPNKHNEAYKSGCIGSNSVLLCCFGGVDACCIEEWVGKTPGLGDWFPKAYNGANILSVFYLDPYGCAANINDYVGVAWDAKTDSYYGEPLNNPAKYMKDNGISYIQTGTVDRVCAILKSLFKGTNPSPVPAAKYVTIAQVVSSASSLKSSIYYYGVLPSTVTVGSYKVSTAQFDYLMSVAIKYLKAGKKTSTKIKIVDASSSNPYYYIKYTVKKSTYASIANKIINYYSSHNKKLPSYVSVGSKKLSYRAYTYSFAKILAYYKSNKKLPGTCLLDSRIYNTRYVTVAKILKASVSVSKYIKSHKKLPSYVTMGSYRVKMPQFTYLMSKAIQLLNSKKKTTTKVKIINSVSTPTTVGSVKYTASKSNYVSMAKKVSSYVSSNKAVPSYVIISSKNLSYKEYMYGFARALSYYYSHKKLPSSVSLYGF